LTIERENGIKKIDSLITIGEFDMSLSVIQLTPFLISIIGGGFAGYFVFRPLANYLSRTEEFSEEETHEILLIYVRNSCLILIIVVSMIAFIKYGLVSISAPVVIAYLSFEIFSATWGACMGMEKKFISSWNFLKIQKNR